MSGFRSPSIIGVRAMSRPGILIVEDEWLVAEEHRTVLEEAGFIVIGPAPSVGQAIRLIECAPILAAIVDIGLNGESSAALIPYLQTRGIPFVFASGHAQADIRDSLRGHQILAKPILAKVLIETVRTLLARGKS